MALTLRVADIATRVIWDDPDLAIAVSDTVRPFLAPDAPPDVRIRLARTGRLEEPCGEKLFDSGLVWRLYRDGDDFAFSFTSASLSPVPYKLARFNSSFTEGTLWLGEPFQPAEGALDPFEFPLPELLMIHQLSRGRGVEIHGCGVIDADGRAYLFAGQSGAGKSTIARLWRRNGAVILSDDRVVLRLRDDRVTIYGTPWHGEDAFADPRSAPLSRMFFLDHGHENRLRPIEGAAAVARLFACSFPPFYDEDGLRFTLELLADLDRRLPSAVLSFAPDEQVIAFVRGGP